MTRRTRRGLFYLLLGLFFVLGVSVVLYAEGWRFDFTKWTPEKVGAVYVRSFPKDAAITLSGKPEENTSNILSQGTFISDLFPRTYTVSLSESGYDEWHEVATVYPSLVTEFKYAVLVPNTPSEIATSTAKNFSILSAGILSQTASNTIVWDGENVAKGNIVSESPSLNEIVLQNTTSGPYSLYNLQNATSVILAAPAGTTNIVIDPYDASNVIASDNSKVWLIDARGGPALQIGHAASGTTLGPAIASPSFVAWTSFNTASGTTSVALYDKFLQSTTKTSSTIAGTTTKFMWIRDGLFGLVQSDGSLYTYDTNSDTFTKLADDVEAFSATSDGSVIAALEQTSIEIFSYNSAITYHRFNLPDIGAVQSVIWYKDMNHLFVVYPDHVSFLDLDDSGLNNFLTIANGSSAAYDPTANSLYLLNPAGELTRFDFPE